MKRAVSLLAITFSVFSWMAVSWASASSQSEHADRKKPDRKKLIKAIDPKKQYRVGPEITLGEVSTRLYGTQKRAKDIAEWNQIPAPYVIRPGQILRLESPPTQELDAGSLQLVNMWRIRLGLGSGNMPFVMKMSIPGSSQPLVHTPVQSTVQPAAQPGTQSVGQASVQPAIQHSGQAKDSRPAPQTSPASELKPLPTQALNQQPSGPQTQGKRAGRHWQAPPGTLFAPELLRAENLFQSDKLPEALIAFRNARAVNPQYLVPWFYELYILKIQKDEKETELSEDELFEARPELRNLPMFLSPESRPKPTEDEQEEYGTSTSPLAQNESRAPASVYDAEMSVISDIFSAGMNYYHTKDYLNALPLFKRCREIKPNLIQAWLYEIRSLILLEKNQDAKATIEALIASHPEVKDLPMFKQEGAK